MGREHVVVLAHLARSGKEVTANAIMIAEAVRQASRAVTAVLLPPPGDGTGGEMFLPRMRETYSMLWDEARSADKPELELSVVPGPGMEACPLSFSAAVAEAAPDGCIASPSFGDPADWHPSLGAVAGLPRAQAPALIDTLPDAHYVDATVPAPAPLPTFRRTVLGGTFDHLHCGHRQLLTYAAACTTEELLVGVTVDAMLHGKDLTAFIQPLPDRRRRVERFVAALRPGLRCVTVPIEDPFGPSIVDAGLDAIALSSETLKGGLAVNARRVAAGLSPLAFVIINRFEGSLSSTFIRRAAQRRRAASPPPVGEAAQ